MGEGAAAPPMNGGRGEGPHDRESPTTSAIPEPRLADGHEKSTENPRIAASEDFKEESGGAQTAGESSAPPESDEARRPSARRSALSNTFCQAGGVSRENGAREVSRGNNGAKGVGGEKEDAPDGGRKRPRDGRGNPSPEGSAHGSPPTTGNKSVKREGEDAAAAEPAVPRSCALDTGAASRDDDGDESDEGLPMPPDLLDPPDSEAQQVTGALTGLQKISDAANSEASNAPAPGATSPGKAFACASKVKRTHGPRAPAPARGAPGGSGQRKGAPGGEGGPLGREPTASGPRYRRLQSRLSCFAAPVTISRRPLPLSFPLAPAPAPWPAPVHHSGLTHPGAASRP